MRIVWIFQFFGSSAKENLHRKLCVVPREAKKGCLSCWRPVNASSDAFPVGRKQVRFLCASDFRRHLLDQRSIRAYFTLSRFVCSPNWKIQFGENESSSLRIEKRFFSKVCLRSFDGNTVTNNRNGE